MALYIKKPATAFDNPVQSTVSPERWTPDKDNHERGIARKAPPEVQTDGGLA